MIVSLREKKREEMPPAEPIIFYIKVTRPETKVKLDRRIKFTKVKLIDVKGIDSCIVYLSAVWKPWALSNLNEVYPGDTIFLNEEHLLGIFPPLFGNVVVGHGWGGLDEFTLRLTKLDGSEPTFENPVIVTIRVSDQ